jgi:hypothetical protein
MNKILIFFLGLSSIFASDINDGNCGICKNVGGNYNWWGSSGKYAHAECFDQIKKVAQLHIDLCDKCFPNNPYAQRIMHLDLINLVEKEINNQGFGSIKHYHDSNGDAALYKIYFSACKQIDRKKLIEKVIK